MNHTERLTRSYTADVRRELTMALTGLVTAIKLDARQKHDDVPAWFNNLLDHKLDLAIEAVQQNAGRAA